MYEVELVESAVGRLPAGFTLSLEMCLPHGNQAQARVVAWIYRGTVQEVHIATLSEMPQDKDRFLTTLLHHLKREDFVFYPKLLAQAVEAYSEGAGIRETWTTKAVVKDVYDEQADCRLPDVGKTIWVWVGVHEDYPKKLVGKEIKVKVTREVNWFGEESVYAAQVTEEEATR